MKTEMIFITPKRADEILSLAKIITPKGSDEANRKLSDQSVRAYARDMKNGEWMTTHQGLLMGKDGLLIDGYHRLNAVKMSKIGQTFLVTTDESLTSPKSLPIDRNVKRTSTYILGKGSSLLAVSTLAFNNVNHTGTPTVHEIDAWSDFFATPFNILVGGKSTTSKGITTAPIMLAGCVQILLGKNPAYISKTFAAMVNATFEDLSPLAGSFYRQVKIDNVKFTPKQTFARALRMFDEDHQNKSKSQVKNDDLAWLEALEYLKQACAPLTR